RPQDQPPPVLTPFPVDPPAESGGSTNAMARLPDAEGRRRAQGGRGDPVRGRRPRAGRAPPERSRAALRPDRGERRDPARAARQGGDLRPGTGSRGSRAADLAGAERGGGGFPPRPDLSLRREAQALPPLSKTLPLPQAPR